MAVDQETRDSFKLVWEQGIGVVRKDIERVDRKIDDSLKAINETLKQGTSSRRYAIAQFIVVLLGVASLVIGFFSKVR